MYERIAGDLGEKTAGTFGEPEHMEKMRASTQEMYLWEKKGNFVALKKWFGWVREFSERFRFAWHSLAFVLLKIGLDTGWFHEGENVPLETDVGLQAEPEEVDGATHAEASDRLVAKLRRKCKNSCHVALEILCNHKKYLSCCTCAELAMPFWHANASEMRDTTNENGTLNTYLGYATGAWDTVFRRCFARLRTSEFANRCGMGKDSSFGPGGREFGPEAEEQELQIASERARDAWSLAVALVKHRAISQSFYGDGLVGFWPMLISADHQRHGLERAKEVWTALEMVDEWLKVSSDAKRVSYECPWVTWCWIRENLVLLREAQFSMVPPPLEADIKSAFLGFGQSEIVENANNRQKDAQRDSKNKKLRRLRRWHRLIQAKLLEQYDRQELEIDVNARGNLPGDVPVSYFDPYAQECSIPKNMLDEVSEGLGWRSPSAQSYHLAVASWQLLVTASNLDDVNLLENAWRTIAFATGDIIRQVNSDEILLVLYSSQYAMLCWTMPSREHNRLTILMPQQGGTNGSSRARWMIGMPLQSLLSRL